MIKISVIVTTYNRPKLLKETLDSILNQTYVDFELIVVDNNSNYDFFKLIESFKDSRIKAYQNDNNGIIATNRNFGIKKAKGEYIAFCDDDDIWLHNKLELQIDRILKNKSDFISSNVLLFNSHTENIISKTNFILPLNFNAFIKLNHVNTSTVITKKTTLLNFDESKDLVTIEDYSLWLKLYKNSYKFDFINEPLVYYRLSDNNASLKNYSIKHIRLMFLFNKIFISTNNISTRFILIKIIIINFFKYIIKKYSIFRKI
tara:strand:- start:760 stop:1539 length:780 start_codon:yes stop_codon:yes gene_type:complete